ncbi:MAG: DUF445 domain-containing protein [Alphaproteobacteria bacterium]|nr:DUF445 domain-containing protein [Alphaproteobacteria bacterium]
MNEHPIAPTTTGEAPEFEGVQRRALRRNKRRATALLLAAVSVFVAASAVHVTGREAEFWVLLVRATAEASVVGALADWFAVTAVFRRPLGLPIPHTAIVPRNKDRIGEGLGAFVTRNFLTPELIATKLRQVDPAGRLAAWLSEPDHAALVAERVTLVLPQVIRSLEDDEIREFAARALGEQLRQADLSSALGKTLALVTAGLPFDTVFDRALDALHKLLDRESGTIYEIVAERAAWWVPRALDRRLAKAIIDGIEELLFELRQPGSDRRLMFRNRLEALAQDLMRSAAHRERLEGLKQQLLEQPDVKLWLASIWDALRNVVIDDLAIPQSRTREALARALLSLGRALSADAAMRHRLGAAVEDAAIKLVVPWRQEIGRFISDVVRSWEARTVVDRLELALGPDLHYIRITGTLVGACVGCVLFLFSRLLG